MARAISRTPIASSSTSHIATPREVDPPTERASAILNPSSRTKNV